MVLDFGSEESRVTRGGQVESPEEAAEIGKGCDEQQKSGDAKEASEERSEESLDERHRGGLLSH